MNWRVGNKELQYVTELLCGGFPGRQERSFVGELEKKFAEKFGSRYAISFTNGTATLHPLRKDFTHPEMIRRPI